MADISLNFDEGWQALINNAQRAIGPAIRQGLRRAGAAALQNTEKHWKPGGGIPPWKPYSDQYRKNKAAGMVAPGRQVSTSSTPDNILTGALKQAAIYMPLTFWPNSWTLVIMPRGPMQRGKSPVADYMNAVFEQRPFYGMTPLEELDVAEQFAIGFINVLKGVPDPVGRHLG